MAAQPAGVDVVMYHYVRPLERTEYPRIRGLHTDAFERQLDWLTANYRILTMPEFLALFEDPTPPREPTALLTFDDGFRDHVEYVLPALRRRGLTGAFYVPSKPVLEHVLLDVHRIQFILASVAESDVPRLLDTCLPHADTWVPEERMRAIRAEAKASRYDAEDVIVFKRLLQRELPRDVRAELAAELFHEWVSDDESAFARQLYLDESDLRQMTDAGMHIGSHAHSHEWLQSLSATDQEDELRRSLDLLARHASSEEWTLAYPYGDFDDRTIAVAEHLGCAAAFTTIVGSAPNDPTQRLRLPRFDTNDFPQ
jgi:peptidoglycan/xylan/chitin deacetylase (PgdA/CDA1 family)